MPKASVVRGEEKEKIIQLIAENRAIDPKITVTQIAKQVGRSKNTVAKLTKTDQFKIYSDRFKQKIDKIRYKAIEQADLQVLKSISKGKMKPYQLIGASKTYYEQSFGLQEKQGQINNDVNVGVQIVREATHSDVIDTNEPK